MRPARRTHSDRCALPAVQDENAWVFCDEEVLGASVKAYIEFEKKLKEKFPKDQRAKASGLMPLSFVTQAVGFGT